MNASVSNYHDMRYKIIIKALSILLFMVGAASIFLGAAWVYTFGFTSYRSHLWEIGLAVGIVTFGGGLLCIVASIKAWKHRKQSARS